MRISSAHRTIRYSLFVLACAACSDGAAIHDVSDPTRITRLGEGSVTAFRASPDGTLFATSGDSLFRAEASDSPRWRSAAFVPFHAIAIYPAQRENAFFLDQRSSDIWQWQEDDPLREWKTPLSDSIVDQGHYQAVVGLVDIVGSGSSELVAVGDRAAILAFGSNGWELEDNPLIPLSRQPAPEWYASALWSVDAYGDRYYAATNTHLLTRDRGTWRMLDLPDGALPLLPITGIAATGDGVVVSLQGRDGRIGLFRHDGSRWVDLSSRATGVRGILVVGRGQADGSALLWGYSQYVVEVRGNTVRTFRIGALGAIRGAARSGRDLYAAGTHVGGGGIVVRLTR